MIYIQKDCILWMCDSNVVRQPIIKQSHKLGFFLRVQSIYPLNKYTCSSLHLYMAYNATSKKVMKNKLSECEINVILLIITSKKITSHITKVGNGSLHASLRLAILWQGWLIITKIYVTIE